MRQGALRSALSERVREGKVTLVAGWSMDKPKTKDFVASLKQLGLDGKTLIHPNQIGPCNTAFSPTDEEVAWARTMIAAADTCAATALALTSCSGSDASL